MVHVITIAEQSAMAKKLPEVKALVSWARMARDAIESLPTDALGTATEMGRYQWPIRDELLAKGNQVLAPFEGAT